MNPILERIRETADERGMSGARLCKIIGLSDSTYRMWFKRDTPPGVEWLVPLSDALEVSPLYLLTGEESEFVYSSKVESVVIKVLGRVAAGVPIEAIEDVIGEERINKDMAKTGEFFGLRISGDSMSPDIKDGCIVIVRQQDDVETGDIAIVVINGEDATCKKIEKHANGIYLIPFNPLYEKVFYSNEDIAKLPVTIIGKVMESRARW